MHLAELRWGLWILTVQLRAIVPPCSMVVSTCQTWVHLSQSMHFVCPGLSGSACQSVLQGWWVKAPPPPSGLQTQDNRGPQPFSRQMVSFPTIHPFSSFILCIQLVSLSLPQSINFFRIIKWMRLLSLPMTWSLYYHPYWPINPIRHPFILSTPYLYNPL